MIPAISLASFAVALALYGGSTVLFFLEVARRGQLAAGARSDAQRRLPVVLLGLGAAGHGAYVTIASFVAHVCPIHSVHFILSVAAIFCTAAYLVVRRWFRIDALGMLVAPLALTFLLGTFFLGKPGPEERLSASFIALHVMAALVGVALFVLAGGAAALYLVQDKRLKNKKALRRVGGLPALDVLDRAIHRFLVAGFPLLTLGILTGTFWARRLEAGTPEEVMRTVFGYAAWFLVAGVLLLRAAAGWRGRRSAYGTLAGFACAMAVLVIYLVRAASPGPGG